MPDIVEDFESATAVVPRTGTWTRVTDSVHSGSYALKSPTTNHNQTSAVDFTIPPGSTTVRLWYRVSTEAVYDPMNIRVDGTIVFSDSGVKNWQQTPEIDVTGAATLRVEYSRDVSAGGGQNAVWIDDLVFTIPVVDEEPPTTPTGLTVTGKTPYSVTLEWQPATDNVAVITYDIYRDGQPAGTSPVTTYTDTGVEPNTTYTYTVRARDAAGNTSPPSSPVTVTTPKAAGVAPIVVDASTPPLVSGSAALTTASFTPPAGALLVACAAFAVPDHPTISHTGPAMTWAKVAALGYGDPIGERGVSAVFVAVCPAAQPVTVTATSTLGNDAGALRVYVLTGIDPATPVGATAAHPIWEDAPYTLPLLTTTRAGSRTVVVSSNWYIDDDSADSTGPGFDYVSWRTSLIGGVAAIQSTPAPAPGTPVAVTLQSTTDLWRGNVVAVEILPMFLPDDEEEPQPATPFRGWGIHL